MLDPSSGDRPEFRSFQRWLNAPGRHRLAHRPPPTAQRVQGPRHVGAEYPPSHVTRGHNRVKHSGEDPSARWRSTAAATQAERSRGWVAA